MNENKVFYVIKGTYLSEKGNKEYFWSQYHWEKSFSSNTSIYVSLEKALNKIHSIKKITEKHKICYPDEKILKHDYQKSWLMSQIRVEMYELLPLGIRTEEDYI